MKPAAIDTGDIVVHHGDCLDILRSLPDASIDAVVTDPPYNLSNSGNRDEDCLRRILTQVQLPDTHEGDSEPFQFGYLPTPGGSGTELRLEDWSVAVDPRVAMPESPVDFQGPTVFQHEVEHGEETAVTIAERVLPLVPDTKIVEDGCDVVLKFADARNTSVCNGTCRCFTEPGFGLLAFDVTAVLSSRCDDPGVNLGRERRRDTDVGLKHLTEGQPKSATGVVASSGAVDTFMLRLDLRNRTGELVATSGAVQQDTSGSRAAPELVGAGPGARGLPPVFESYRVSVINGATLGTFTLHLPAISHLIKPRVTGGFMGRAWDGWESPASYYRWCAAWATECLRVLKPGGHLLAFGGTRTWHRLACGVEDAGFELRDTITWLYSQGFPKSHDVSKAIDKAAGAAREVIGVNEDYLKRKPNGMKTTGATTYGYSVTDYPTDARVTTPATDAAKQWSGWGTALKPASEPILVARKPLAGTVAQNVMQYGTGALNIEGCRVATNNDLVRPAISRTNNEVFGTGLGAGVQVNPIGRWPANVILTHASTPEGTDACLASCVDDCPVKQLDEQTGILTSGANPTRRGTSKFRDAYGEFQGQPECVPARGSDAGGASRFFPTFRYHAKATARERPRIDGVAHPTVKPLRLMQYLIRLIAPPGAIILDPFAGSGTTLEAAVLENMRAIGVESDDTYLPLVAVRLERVHNAVKEATQ
jgi:DNA modification methylase